MTHMIRISLIKIINHKLIQNIAELFIPFIHDRQRFFIGFQKFRSTWSTFFLTQRRKMDLIIAVAPSIITLAIYPHISFCCLQQFYAKTDVAVKTGIGIT